jgi:hypothetical protein
MSPSSTNWINVHLQPGSPEQTEKLDTLAQEIMRTGNKLARPENYSIYRLFYTNGRTS